MTIKAVGTSLGVLTVLLAALVAVGLFVSQSPRRLAKPGSETILKRGNYEQYLYAIEAAPGNKKVVQFEPSLLPDDNVVIPGLRQVAKDAFGLGIGDDVQPVVENRNDTNYITFAAGSGRVWCELFRNSSGRVGSARLWLEP